MGVDHFEDKSSQYDSSKRLVTLMNQNYVGQHVIKTMFPWNQRL